MNTLITNGKIYVEKGLFHEAMLIQDGIIVQTGSNSDFESASYENHIDLGGKTVIPGLNDSHLHLSYVGTTMRSCKLNQARSIEEIIEIGKNHLEANPGTAALYGRGWNQDYFVTGEKRMINRHDLDQISTDIPIVFVRVCGHMATGNSKAIEMLGVDETTTVEGGVIQLGGDGQPDGIFCESATALLDTVIPEKTDLDIEKDFLTAADYAISMGLTSVQSCDIQNVDAQRIFKVIRNIYADNKTRLRFSHQFNFQDISGLEDYINTELNSDGYDEKFLSRGALKLFIDGSLGARTAFMLSDYHDEPGTRGVSVLSQEQLDDILSLASQHNIRVVTHAIGDGAVEMLINAYEQQMNGGENTLRHGIVHCQITSAQQLERIAALKIPVLYQPIFLDYDIQIVEDRVGEHLASTSYAFNTLYQLGTPVSFGTDSPVEDLNPWENLYCAVTRQRLDGTPEGGFCPEERMDISDAIDCYTTGSAFNEFREDFKGRLMPGYAADLAVLDRDIFEIEPAHIKDVRVDMTMINGEVVYTRQ